MSRNEVLFSPGPSPLRQVLRYAYHRQDYKIRTKQQDHQSTIQLRKRRKRQNQCQSIYMYTKFISHERDEDHNFCHQETYSRDTTGHSIFHHSISYKLRITIIAEIEILVYMHSHQEKPLCLYRLHRDYK